jgi:hypothetical protein
LGGDEAQGLVYDGVEVGEFGEGVGIGFVDVVVVKFGEDEVGVRGVLAEEVPEAD